MIILFRAVVDGSDSHFVARRAWWAPTPTVILLGVEFCSTSTTDSERPQRVRITLNPFEKQRVCAFLILVVMGIVVRVVVARHGDGGRQSDQSAVASTVASAGRVATRQDATRSSEAQP